MLLEKVVIPEKEATKIRCIYSGHEWTYTGHKEWYCSCPACHSSVKLKAKPRIKKSKKEDKVG